MCGGMMSLMHDMVRGRSFCGPRSGEPQKRAGGSSRERSFQQRSLAVRTVPELYPKKLRKTPGKTLQSHVQGWSRVLIRDLLQQAQEEWKASSDTPPARFAALLVSPLRQPGNVTLSRVPAVALLTTLPTFHSILATEITKVVAVDGANLQPRFRSTIHCMKQSMSNMQSMYKQKQSAWVEHSMSDVQGMYDRKHRVHEWSIYLRLSKQSGLREISNPKGVALGLS
eukprot:1161526-Pelagomonas_calceolata.AAC.4